MEPLCPIFARISAIPENLLQIFYGHELIKNLEGKGHKGVLTFMGARRILLDQSHVDAGRPIIRPFSPVAGYPVNLSTANILLDDCR